MICANARSVIPMEVLVEQYVISPVRVVLERLCSAEHRPPSIVVQEKNIGQPARNLFSHFKKGEKSAGSGRTFDAKIISIIKIELKQRANEERVHRDPDRPSPV